MRIMSLLPHLGVSVAHRTTREWRFGGSTQREESDGLAQSLRNVVGAVTAATLGAGLTFLLSPATRAAVRNVLSSSFAQHSTAAASGVAKPSAAHVPASPPEGVANPH